jgi:hypothetical protein
VRWTTEPPTSLTANVARSLELFVKPVLDEASATALRLTEAATAAAASMSPHGEREPASSIGKDSALGIKRDKRASAAALNSPASPNGIPPEPGVGGNATRPQALVRKDTVQSTGSSAGSAATPSQQLSPGADAAMPPKRPATNIPILYTPMISQRWARLAFALCHFHGVLQV